MSRIAKRCIVSGRVQGVFFRASAREQARTLGVSGHARNLPDGRVEVLAVGNVDAVQALEEWLWKGSPAANVVTVSSYEIALDQLGELPTEFKTT